MKIGRVKLNFDYYSPEKDIYSDGDIEEEILCICKKGLEKEVLRTDDRWPILYYFSPIRQNILSWYKFKRNSDVLEIGTGCGAITGMFCKKNLHITGIESSKRRSLITAYRNQDYEKLEIYVGNFAEMNFTKKFDYITMIGVLEYANMFLPNSRNAFVDMICRCKELLKDDGKLFIAIENRLGMKYWAGAAEDHTGICFDGIENYPKTDRVRTFSKSELEQIVVSAGMSKIEWFYPYPDYKLPMQIFSDAFLPTPELLSGDVSAYDSDRIQLFNERKALQSMAGTEEFKIFSNSFLLVVGK